MAYHLLDFERETSIHFDDSSDIAGIYTRNKAVAGRLKRYGLKVLAKDGPGYYFEVPKQALCLKIGRKSACYFAGKANPEFPDRASSLPRQNTIPEQSNAG